MSSLLAVLPYWEVPPIKLGPISLQPFGILVATGVLIGASMSRRRAEKLGVDDDLVRALVGWTIIVGFVGAHVFDVLFYQWSDFKSDPLLIVQIWKGISSYGGFLGAIIGYIAFTRIHKVTNHRVMGDIAAWGILPGFTFGRMGCATVHDHPGSLSDFFLAIDFPARSYVSSTHGVGSRHDLGFYELLFLLGFNLVFWTLVLSKERRHGFAIGLVALGYAPVRFLLEPMRLPSTDPRFLGMTPAQFVSIALLMTGVIIMVKIYRQTQEQAFSLAGIPAAKFVGGVSTGKKKSQDEPAEQPKSPSKTAGMKKKKKKKR